MRDVVVTGFGIVTALGSDASETESALRRGRSGVGPITLFDASANPGLTAAEVRDLAVPEGLSRGSGLLLAAVEKALDSAGLGPGLDADLVLGTTLGGMERGTAFMREVREHGPDRADAALLLDFLPSCQAAGLKERFRLAGRTLLLNNACSSGTDALGIALERVRSGESDRVLAGGYDTLCEFVLTGFASLMNVTRTRCRPFDRDRDGLVLGEGACILVLEGSETAAARSASPLGYVRGFGAASDAFHMTQPDPGGFGIGEAMKAALESAGLAPGDVGYLNLHGTGTKINDLSEYHGVRTVFGEGMEGLSCGSTKALTGHTLGAAGAVEAAFCLLALRGGFLPPNVGFENADPKMPGLNVTSAPADKRFRFAMSNSLGFGGEASSLVLEGPRRERTVSQTDRTMIAGGACLTALCGPEAGALLHALLLGGRSGSGASTSLSDFDPGVHIASRQLRRMTQLGALSLVVASKALDHAGFELDAGARSDDVDIVFASTHGATNYLWKFHEGYLEDGPSGASPILFTNGVTNAPAGHISLEFGIRGRALTFVGNALSSYEALCEAVSLTRGGRRTVIAGASEEESHALELAYRRVRESGLRSAKPGPGSLPLCAGAAVLVLSGTPRPGPWIEKPCFDRSLSLATGRALRDAGLSPEDPDFVVCSLRGWEHDGPEAEELGAVFGGRTRALPIVAPMRNLGEGFSLTSMLLVLVSAEILGRGVIPPAAPSDPPELPAPLFLPSSAMESDLQTGLVVYRDGDGSGCALVMGIGA